MSLPLPDWKPAALPEFRPVEGKFVRLEPLDPAKHADALWEALQGPDSVPTIYDYIVYWPFESRSEFDACLAKKAATYLTYSSINRANGKAEGLIGYSSIDANNGTVELAWVFGTCVHGTPRSTEARFMLIKEAFALGYRRVESAAATGNEGSGTATSKRLGFVKEGVLRQKHIYKGTARDVVCSAILANEWPVARDACEQWLADHYRLKQRGEYTPPATAEQK